MDCRCAPTFDDNFSPSVCAASISVTSKHEIKQQLRRELSEPLRFTCAMVKQSVKLKKTRDHLTNSQLRFVIIPESKEIASANNLFKRCCVLNLLLTSFVKNFSKFRLATGNGCFTAMLRT